jgi:hypothetical protein
LARSPPRLHGCHAERAARWPRSALHAARTGRSPDSPGEGRPWNIARTQRKEIARKNIQIPTYRQRSRSPLFSRCPFWLSNVGPRLPSAVCASRAPRAPPSTTDRHGKFSTAADKGVCSSIKPVFHTGLPPRQSCGASAEALIMPDSSRPSSNLPIGERYQKRTEPAFLAGVEAEGDRVPVACLSA